MEARRPAHVYARRYAAHEPPHYATRHYAWRHEPRYAPRSENPVAAAANGAVGAMADLGSIAAYPIYCFPDYGSCPMRWYR
jgi:hypothetical protein